jgi:hypothetical protein
MMDEAPVPFPSPMSRSAILGMLPTMLVDGVLPFIIYLMLRPLFPSTSVIPLAAAAFFPFVGNIVNIVRHRRLDAFGALVLLSLLASIVILVIGGDQRLLLLTKPLSTLVLGLACLGSLLLPKPLSYYMLRQLATAEDRERVAAFDGLWQYPYVRAVHHLLTAVFGLVMVGQYAVKIVLVFTLPIAQVLLIAPLIMNGMGMATMVWMIVYGRHATRRVRSTIRLQNRDVRQSTTDPHHPSRLP